jgi:hypothetical protein
MNRIVLAGVSLMTMGCTPVPPAAEPGEDPVPEQGAGNCNAAPAQSLVGRLRSAELGAEALRLSAAATIRWIPPGTAVTMDYREDRLNIELDGRNRVTRIRCG